MNYLQLNKLRPSSVIQNTLVIWQIPLDNESSKLCTFSTPFGRYCFLRMPFGINSAPEIFHKRFKEIFDMEGTEVYMDDIVVWGSDKGEHDKRLLNMLKTTKENNITFNLKKCKFGLSKIKFLGHKFSNNGLSPDSDKIKAIHELKIPQDKQSLQKFLGMINYVGRFVPNLATLNSPLRDLLRKNVDFKWNQEHTKAFNELKEKITLILLNSV